MLYQKSTHCPYISVAIFFRRCFYAIWELLLSTIAPEFFVNSLENAATTAAADHENSSQSRPGQTGPKYRTLIKFKYLKKVYIN